MKLSITAAVLSGLALVSAQFAGEPPCAATCLSSAVVQIGCALNDVGCQCGAPAQASLLTVAAGCLIAGCPASSLFAIQSIGNALCVSYSAMLTAGNTLATVTSTAAAPASTTAGVVMSTATGAGVTSAATGAVPNSTITAVTSGTAASTAAAGGNSTAAASSVSKAGAAGVAAGSIGGLAALVLGAVALF